MMHQDVCLVERINSLDAPIWKNCSLGGVNHESSNEKYLFPNPSQMMFFTSLQVKEQLLDYG